MGASRRSAAVHRFSSHPWEASWGGGRPEGRLELEYSSSSCVSLITHEEGSLEGPQTQTHNTPPILPSPLFVITVPSAPLALPAPPPTARRRLYAGH